MKTENSTLMTRIGRIGADFDPRRFAPSAKSACDFMSIYELERRRGEDGE